MVSVNNRSTSAEVARDNRNSQRNLFAEAAALLKIESAVRAGVKRAGCGDVVTPGGVETKMPALGD